MTLTEMKAWLDENGIEYKEETYSYSGEMKEPETPSFFSRLFAVEPLYKSGKELIIESKNGKRNLELSFGRDNTNYIFTLMMFGNYLFDIDEEDFNIEEAAELVRSVIQGNKKFICEYGEDFADDDISDNDECFDMADPKERDAFHRKVDRIRNVNQGMLNKVIKFLYQVPKKYEIYDWNTYECIVRE